MNVITVDHVSKVYPLYDKTIDRLKETLSLTHKSYHKDFFALEDINFSIEAGETVGIVGTNGSGKSTILKIITGVLNPSRGNVTINGKISALLELGAGFNMDYTGMENLYMNGTMMGYSREEMEQKIPGILEFADIGDFVNQPVKTYSSGMFVRLAFALAVSVEPEIMIVDEALSVGDAFFQAKCFDKLEEIKKRGTTILFVSHDIFSVKRLCNRAIWIEKGHLKMDGAANDVCEKYLSMQIEENNKQKELMVQKITNDNTVDAVREVEKVYFRHIDFSDSSQITESGKATIEAFFIKDKNNNEVTVLRPNEEYTFGIVGTFKENVKNALFGFELENTKGVKIFSVNNFLSDSVIEEAIPNNVYEVNFTFCIPALHEGEYLLSPCIAAGNQDNHVVHVRLHNCMMVVVDNEGYNLALLDVDAKTSIIEHNKDSVNYY